MAPTCTVCREPGRPLASRGMCWRCYQRARRGTPPVIKDKRIVVRPSPPHYELLANAPGPDLPARQPGEDEESYQRRLKGYSDTLTGRRTRPHHRRRFSPLDLHHGGER